jgi:hypothetical protein
MNIKEGFRAEFNTGYLQIETVLHQALVKNGQDKSVHDATKTGYGVGRLVKVTKNTDGTYTIDKPSTGVGSLAAGANESAITTALAAGIGDATHIIAQSDNTIRDTIDDYVKDEKYDGIVKNSPTEHKTVAVYKIVNADDIKLVRVYA